VTIGRLLVSKAAVARLEVLHVEIVKDIFLTGHRQRIAGHLALAHGKQACLVQTEAKLISFRPHTRAHTQRSMNMKKKKKKKGRKKEKRTME
jgi:hypothetical protein